MEQFQEKKLELVSIVRKCFLTISGIFQEILFIFLLNQ